MLKPKDMIQRLRRAQILVNQVYEETDIPQIQSIMRHADQNLHWALWNLGEVDELRPDLPGSVKPLRGSARPQGTTARKKAKK